MWGRVLFLDSGPLFCSAQYDRKTGCWADAVSRKIHNKKPRYFSRANFASISDAGVLPRE
jgi:hypothetical protein